MKRFYLFVIGLYKAVSAMGQHNEGSADGFPGIRNELKPITRNLFGGNKKAVAPSFGGQRRKS